MNSTFDLNSLPLGVLVILAVLLIAEIALDVTALVSLARRPRSMVALGNKWIWVLIIVLVNLIGAILYFVVGRKSVPAADDAHLPPGGSPTTSVADSLYGERKDQDSE